MFTTLKKKIKDETGSDIATNANANMQQPHQRLINHLNNNNHNNNNNRMRSRFSSTLSVNSNVDDIVMGGGGIGAEVTETQLCHLRSQCNELTTKVTSLSLGLQQLQEEKLRVDKTNEILLESVKVAQTQKDLYCEDQEKIQNLQQHEIEKLKSLLSFREQEAVDRLNAMRQLQQQTEHLTLELERIKPMEPLLEDLRDELQQMQHAAQQERNQLSTTLAAVQEENRHLKMRIKIVDEARLETLKTLNAEEKMHAFLMERRLLEQHLEEAQLQLSDIKSSWSGQNLALETQVSRLSKQVAEETTEKRKALKARDDANEKIKTLEFELQKIQDEMKQRDNKIKLLEEEIDELNSALKECREENEQQILFERNKAETLEMESKDLKSRLETAEERFTDYASNAEQISNRLREQNATQLLQLNEAQTQLESEREEKLTALLRNAEISQSEELLKKELRIERDDSNELHEKISKLEANLKTRENDLESSRIAFQELKALINTDALNEQKIEELQQQLSEKSKTIKMLNQRLADLKKTLQKEFRQNTTSLETTTTTTTVGSIDVSNEFNGLNKCYSTNVSHTTPLINATDSAILNISNQTMNGGSSIVMDEVNFKYLKHVIVKFLTSREVEARHLIRAVATLLQLTTDEEKLLHDTLNWKRSWFWFES